MASLTSMRPNGEFYALGRDFPIAGSWLRRTQISGSINWTKPVGL